MQRLNLYLVVFILVTGLSISSASAILFTGDGGDLSASVDFVQVNDDLVVTLTNTSLMDVMNPSQVLTAVFFNLDGGVSLTPVSAELNGSVVLGGFPDGGGNVGGEWAYASGLSGAPGGADMGISSSGFDLFGEANFNGDDLQNPTAVNGLNYGITSAGDDFTTGNTPVTGGNRGHQVALIQNSVVFALSGLPDDFVLSADSLSNISFQYGTSLDEPNVPVPEPATILLLGFGLVGLAGYGRKKLKK